MTEKESSNKENTETIKIDHLKEDLPIPGQHFCCISFISPEGVKNTTIRGVKVRGVFDTYDEASAYAKKLQQDDPLFNIYVGEVGKWLPWDPSPDDKTKVKDSQYAEEELQNVMREYEKNSERAKKAESDRKQSLMRKALQDAKINSAKEKLEAEKDKLRQKVQENKKNQNKKPEEPKVPKQDENDKVTKEKIVEREQEIKRSEDNLQTLDANLNKLKDIYANIQEKKRKLAEK
ncbi:hypothetical protein Catovirus_2_278 [Catovirus CTV1]|uniref:Uncharacterized protein n=1 Tax=Catovirus CTV1 TaxID=1977631 RepID=A0A1V0SC94_9VIRU|nr:hypothetical protein Catovirus_2_278 [Catovirus CTV1]